MTRKSKKRRRGKQGKSGRTSSRPASMRKLAQAGYKVLEKVRRFHSGEFRFYALTYCDVLAAQGNYAAALSWLNLLSKALPRSPGVWPRRVRYRIGRLLHRKQPSQSQMG